MDTRRASTLVVGAALCLMAVIWPAAAAALQDPSGWTQIQGDPGRTGAVSDAPAPGYQQSWALTVPLGGPDKQFGLSAPVIDPSTDSAVSVGPNQVMGVDVHTGKQTFSVPRVYGPSVAAAIAQVGDGSRAIVYTQGWGATTPTASGTPTPSASASPSASPSGGGSDAAAEGSHVSQLVGIDFLSHKPLWHPVTLQATSIARPVRAGVTVWGNTAYVGDSGGSVYAVDLESGKLLWKAPAGGAIASALAATSALVLVTTQGTRTTAPSVVALKASDGKVVWNFSGGSIGALATSPVVSGSDVYVAFSDGNLVSLSLGDGSKRWSARINAPVLPIGGLAVSGDAVYAYDIVGQLYRFDTADGSLVWDFALNQQATSAPPIVAGDHVVVATDTGLLAAIDAGTGHLVWESGPQGGLIRGLTPTADQIVAVRGGDHPGLVAYAHDPDVALTDVVSPTVFDARTNALSFFIVAIPLFALVFLGGRLLGRRMGPAFIYEDDDVAPSDPIEDGTSS